MRIPTGLNDGSLYHQRRHKRPEPSAYRRLLRLVLALVLVIVVMKEAGKPGIYRIFFSEPVSPRFEASTSFQNDVTDFSDSSDGNAAGHLMPPLTGTVANLSETDRKQLSRVLAQYRLKKPNQASDTSTEAEALRSSLFTAAELAGESLSLLDPADPFTDPKGRLRLQAALDETYLQHVSDGAIWKNSDNDAFYRTLEAGGRIGLEPRRPRRVGIVPLLQQPEVYLHRPVAMTASVARVVRLDAKTNDFGVGRYWELWLQPNDGSQRPVAFYASTVPTYIQALVDIDYHADGPIIDIEGLYLKRLAFRSKSGSELAPAIVGRITSMEIVPTLLPVTTSPQDAVSWGALTLLAAFVGIGLAILIMVATKRSAQRLRQARRSYQHLGTSDLQALSADLKRSSNNED